MKQEYKITSNGKECLVPEWLYEVAWELKGWHHQVFGRYYVNFNPKGFCGNMRKDIFRKPGGQKEEVTIYPPTGNQLDVPEGIFEAVQMLRRHYRRVNPMPGCFEIPFSNKGKCLPKKVRFLKVAPPPQPDFL